MPNTAATGKDTNSDSAETMRNEPVPAYLGDWVRTQHNQVGQVFQVHVSCPQDDDWLELQSIPVTEEQRISPWVSVLVHGNGSVVTPRSTVAVLADHPAHLDNRWADFYFGNAR